MSELIHNRPRGKSEARSQNLSRAKHTSAECGVRCAGFLLWCNERNAWLKRRYYNEQSRKKLLNTVRSALRIPHSALDSISSLCLIALLTLSPNLLRAGTCRPQIPQRLNEQTEEAKQNNTLAPRHSQVENSDHGLAIEELFLTPQPSFLWLPNIGKIPNSQRTVAAIARYNKSNGQKITFLTAKEQRQLEAKYPHWQTQIIQNASRYLATLVPQYIRDKNNILNAIVFDGDAPITPSILFTPELYAQFEYLLGPEFLAVAPTASKVILFPKLATKIQHFAPPILSEYRIAEDPISIEVFEVSSTGVRAVGILDDR